MAPATIPLTVWTDGLPSNLVAEFVGLVLSILATYLVVDKLIEVNRRRHHRPLRALLRRAVGQNLAAMSHLWAYEFGLVAAGDLQGSFEHELPKRVAGYSALIEARLAALESSTAGRDAFIGQRGDREVIEIARETAENVTAIGAVAGRVSQVVLEDEVLESLLADLEAEARGLDHVRSFVEYLSEVKHLRDLPLDLLLSLSLKSYRGTEKVWQAMEQTETQQP